MNDDLRTNVYESFALITAIVMLTVSPSLVLASDLWHHFRLSGTSLASPLLLLRSWRWQWDLNLDTASVLNWFGFILRLLVMRWLIRYVKLAVRV